MFQSACWLVAVFGTWEVGLEKQVVATFEAGVGQSALLAFFHLLQYVRQPRVWRCCKVLCWLVAVFDTSEVDLKKPMVATCETAMTACGLAAAAHMLGKEIVPVYNVSV